MQKNLDLNVDKIILSALPGDAPTGLEIQLTIPGHGSYLYSFGIGTKVPGGAGLATSTSGKKSIYRVFDLDTVPEVLHKEVLSFDHETGKGVVQLTCRINSMTPDSRTYSPTEKKSMRELMLNDSPKDISMQASINVMANAVSEDTELVITLPVALLQ